MFNKKNLSVLFAVVLLCVSVAGVIFIGAQADDAVYTDIWYVDGTGGDETHYTSIDAAVQAAAGTSWSAGDSLIIYITDSTPEASALASQRKLFQVDSIFRGDNTLLPIAIDGGSNRNGFSLSGTAHSEGINCTNAYTFQNMDLDWGTRGIHFRAGSGKVTFDNVTFGGNNMFFSADCTNSAMFSSWTSARINAMKEADGFYDISLTFKNTTYNGSTYKVSARDYTGNVGGNVPVAQTRSKLILGEGAKIGEFAVVAVAIPEYPSGAYALEIQEGATATTIYGVRGSYAITGGNIEINVTGGSVGTLYSGPNTGSLASDITTTVSGGTVTTLYGGGKSGSVGSENTVTNNILGGTVTTFCGGTLSSASQFNTVKNIIGKDDGTGPRITNYVGGSAGSATIIANIENTIKGGTIGADANANVTSSNRYYAYLGSNYGTVGRIVNHIQGGDFNNYYTYCGNSSNASFNTSIATWAEDETEHPEIKNVVTGGDFIRFAGGTAKSDAALICNEIGGVSEDAIVASTGFYCGQGSGANTTVKNTFNGYVNTVFGGSNGNSILRIENTVMEGAKVKVFRGGSNSGTVGSIENFFNGGEIVGSGSNVSYGGSKTGTVTSTVTNHFAGTEFNAYYIYGGNDEATFSSTGDQIINYISGGSFLRFAGGSVTGTVASIKNYVGKNADGTVTSGVIEVEKGFYCGHGASSDTTVINDITATVLVKGTKGTEDEKLSGIYGGGNGGDIATIKNTIGTGAKLGTFHGGSNTSGTITAIINTFNGGEIETAYGGSTKGGGSVKVSGDTVTVTDNATMVTSVTNLLNGTTVDTFYGGSQSGKIGEVTNNYNSGKIRMAIGGSQSVSYVDVTASQKAAKVVEVMSGEESTITNRFLDGSDVTITYFAGGHKSGNSKKITNEFASSDATFGVAYGGNYGPDSNDDQTGGGTASAIVNTFSSGTFDTVFGGCRRGKVMQITNTIASAVTFNENFYGGNNQGIISDSENEISHNVYTTVNGGTFKGRFYGGSYYGDITGNIKTIVHAGTFSGDVFSGSRNGNITQPSAEDYCVEFTIYGGSFVRYIGGGDGMDGFQKNAYGGDITGDIINYIHGGTFSGETSVNSNAASWGMILGGFYGDITGSVTNHISAPVLSAGKMTSGGGFMNNITASGSKGYAIENVISGGTFYGFWGGSNRNVTANNFKVVGDIINTVRGGTFNSYVSGNSDYSAFAGSCVHAGHEGSVSNTISGGTFNGYFSGGACAFDTKSYADLKLWIGQVTTTITSSSAATFNKTLYVGSRNVAYYTSSSGDVKLAALYRNGKSVNYSLKNIYSTKNGSLAN